MDNTTLFHLDIFIFMKEPGK